MEATCPEHLKGLWAAVPTPFTEAGSFSREVLERNIEKYASIPMDGVYTTDSDGEFYALELAEFKQLAKSFAQAMSQTSMRAAMGATWCNTAGAIDRMKAGLDCGIRAFHVTFPFWMPLAPCDRLRFWEDLARAVPQARWIHYNTPRGGTLLGGKDYAALVRDFPDQFIGTKLGTTSPLEMVDCIQGAPEVAHLTVDYATVPGMMLGAAGTCSFWANTLPHWTRRMTDLCLEKRWEEAMAMQKRLLVWEARYTRPIRDAGHLHGIVGKARSSLTDFLEDSGMTRPPYYPVDAQLVAEFQAHFDDYWKDES